LANLTGPGVRESVTLVEIDVKKDLIRDGRKGWKRIRGKTGGLRRPCGGKRGRAKGGLGKGLASWRGEGGDLLGV